MLPCGVLIGDCRFTAIDFESAGAAPGRTDVPVQVGLAGWTPGAGHGETFVSYLAAEVPITWSARKVHGIRDEDLAGAPGLLALWPELKRRLAGAVVVAHGKGTEKRFLRAFPGHGFGPWVDTLLLARAAWPELPDHSLSELCEARGISATVAAMLPGKRWHDALYDAVASLVLLEDLATTFDLAGRPLGLAPYSRHQRLAPVAGILRLLLSDPSDMKGFISDGSDRSSTGESPDFRQDGTEPSTATLTSSVMAMIFPFLSI